MGCQCSTHDITNELLDCWCSQCEVNGRGGRGGVVQDVQTFNKTFEITKK